MKGCRLEDWLDGEGHNDGNNGGVAMTRMAICSFWGLLPL